MQYLLSTTGTLSSVTIDDFGARSFDHPTTDYDIILEYTEDEIKASIDLQSAIDNGYIIITNENGDIITNLNSSEKTISVQQDDTPVSTDISIINFTGTTTDLIEEGKVTVDVSQSFEDLSGVPSKPNDGNEYILKEVNNVLTWINKNEFIRPATGSGIALISMYYGGTGTKVGLKFKSDTWAVGGAFIFYGTDIVGTPSYVEILARSKDGKNSWLRLYDYTNGNEIAQICINSNTRQIYSNNSLANLPTGKSVIEVQGKISEDRKELYINEMSLRY